MQSHLTLAGDWVSCERGCELPFHVALSPAEAAAIPERLLWPVCDSVQPPTHTAPSGAVWQWFEETEGLLLRPHRDYDLPAEVCSSGAALWYRHGELHRDHDRPASIGYEGTMTWYQHGKVHRDGDRPADIRSDGTRTWYERGQVHRFGGPAVINPHGVGEYWEHGVFLRTDYDWV